MKDFNEFGAKEFGALWLMLNNDAVAVMRKNGRIPASKETVQMMHEILYKAAKLVHDHTQARTIALCKP